MAGVLLIDDDQAVLNTLRALAEAAGFDLRTAGTWDEGLALFLALAPQLVIADYNLPGSQHGLQLLAEIRHLRPSVRVILISGIVPQDDLERVRNLGVVDRVLPKGASIETTKELLEEGKRASEEVQRPTDWKEFAKAFQVVRAVSSEHLENLDAYLRETVEPER